MDKLCCKWTSCAVVFSVCPSGAVTPLAGNMVSLEPEAMLAS